MFLQGLICPMSPLCYLSFSCRGSACVQRQREKESQPSSTAREQQHLVFGELHFFHSPPLLYCPCPGPEGSGSSVTVLLRVVLCPQAGTGHGHCWGTAGLHHSSSSSKGDFLGAVPKAWGLFTKLVSRRSPRNGFCRVSLLCLFVPGVSAARSGSHCGTSGTEGWVRCCVLVAHGHGGDK